MNRVEDDAWGVQDKWENEAQTKDKNKEYYKA